MNDHSRDQLAERADHLFITLDHPAPEHRSEVVDRIEVARHCRRMQLYHLHRWRKRRKISSRRIAASAGLR
ncbi:MAG: hypothetical protein WAV78_48375 [Xanthobacteraceae bacterium]